MHGSQRLSLVLLPVILTLVYGACATTPPHSLVGPADPVQEDVDALARSPLELPDPGAPGPYTPAMFLYSGGLNPRRAEYAPQEVAVRTRTVDVSPFVDEMEERYWGYGTDAVPLNGRLHHPVEPGVYPVVVMVHGNHPPYHFSEAGYDYLGRHLASHGMIFASVDQNFLNGLSDENDARAIVLLEHAKLILGWNDDPANPLAGRVDTERVAIAGHSRGGEAAVHAAVFNRYPAYPDDVTVPFEYDLPVRAVISIAPVEGQYRPAGRRLTVPRDVDYLVLHGSHDGDVTEHFGLRFVQREPLEVPPRDVIRAGIWIYGANHAQFNTSWAGRGQDPRPTLRANLLPEAEQQQIARVTFTALLLAAFDRTPEYRDFLADPGRGREWLPETRYVTHFSDNAATTIADFDDDPFLETARIEGWRIGIEGFSRARERQMPFSSVGQITSDRWAFSGEWEAADTVEEASADADPEQAEPDAPAVIRFAAFDERDAIRAQRIAFDIAAVSLATGDDEDEPLAFELLVHYGASRTDRLDLTHFASIRPAPPVNLLFQRLRHNVPQSVVVPVDANDPIVAIELVFSRDRAAEVVVDALRYYPATEVTDD